MSLEEKIIRIINENIEDNDVNITLQSNIQNDLGLDSLSVIMVLNALEEEFDILLEVERFVGIETVGEMIEHVKEEHPGVS